MSASDEALTLLFSRQPLRERRAPRERVERERVESGVGRQVAVTARVRLRERVALDKWARGQDEC